MDERKRQVYNDMGFEGLEKMGDENDFGDFGGFQFPGGFNPFGQQQPEVIRKVLEKLFFYNNLFEKNQLVKLQRGDDIVIALMITLEELFIGTKITLTQTEKSIRDAPGTRNCNCRVEMRTVQACFSILKLSKEKSL